MAYEGRLFSYDNLFQNGMIIPIGKVFQVSELSIIRGSEIASHVQHCDEITYVISGSAVFYSNDEKNEIKAGQIHYVKKGIAHKIEASDDEDFRFLCIGFIPDKKESIVNELYEAMKSLTHFIINDNGIIKSLSDCLMCEFYNWDEYSISMINQYLSQIITSVTRILKEKKYSHHNATYEKSSYYAMYKILRFIDREYLHISSVKEISEALSYSNYYLSHLFKEKMGITIKEYLTKKKITYATELLKTSELSVEQIAEQLHFSSAHSFRRAFKQYTSFTPTDYKDLK